MSDTSPEAIEALIRLIDHNKQWEGLQDIDVEAYKLAASTIHVLVADRKEADIRAHAMVAAWLREAATLAMRWVHPQSRSDRLRDAILALITPDDNTALDKLLAEAERRGMERAAEIAYESGCGFQELRSAALSGSWPEDAARHMSSEHAAFGIAAAIRAEMNGGDDEQ